MQIHFHTLKSNFGISTSQGKQSFFFVGIRLQLDVKTKLEILNLFKNDFGKNISLDLA